ncbi:hypothetical protein pneo_cds_946 [Pandoravirus neocaledonia]|uniref:Uncharacterized protein n=1 Tax=Pandoravirus neocaledonia TaxID=2107708 RepID=A0A2U7UDP4_9VIRU|nr:hypothetical protein pneo_cds_946 [Pandoravirus neocaledonia]AVK76553.1 hypothetical protein pneo_cds_946 [Pandoravirus neocaledonia]
MTDHNLQTPLFRATSTLPLYPGFSMERTVSVHCSRPAPAAHATSECRVTIRTKGRWWDKSQATPPTRLLFHDKTERIVMALKHADEPIDWQDVNVALKYSGIVVGDLLKIDGSQFE